MTVVFGHDGLDVPLGVGASPPGNAAQRDEGGDEVEDSEDEATDSTTNEAEEEETDGNNTIGELHHHDTLSDASSSLRGVNTALHSLDHEEPEGEGDDEGGGIDNDHDKTNNLVEVHEPLTDGNRSPQVVQVEELPDSDEPVAHGHGDAAAALYFNWRSSVLLDNDDSLGGSARLGLHVFLN